MATDQSKYTANGTNSNAEETEPHQPAIDTTTDLLFDVFMATSILVSLFVFGTHLYGYIVG